MEAARSSGRFGESVLLKGLQSEQYNGQTGVMGGYDVDSGRRIVRVKFDGQEKEILVRPQNLFVAEDCIYESVLNLVDVPDCLGSVALHEVVILSVMSGDSNAAKFLCFEHNASVDVKELSGVSPRSMVLQPM